MLVDRQTLLSDRQVVTVQAFSTDSYDLGAGSPSRNMGRLNGLRAVFTCQLAALAAGAATVTFEIGEADDAAGTGYQILAASAPIGKAAILAGTKPFDVPIPDTTKRFIMGRYTIGTGPLTQGTFSLALLRGSDHLRNYPDGYNGPGG